MKDKVIKIYRSDYFPLLIVFLLMSLLHLTITPNTRDDAWFAAIWPQGNQLNWLYSRYTFWTSRIIIEFVLIFITGNKMYWVWRLMDVAAIILILFSISKICINKHFRKFNWWLCGLFLLYPFKDMCSAGWAATTLNYLWPLGLGLLSMLSIYKKFKNQPLKWYEGFIYLLALIYASNQEQTAFLLSAIFGVATLCYLYKNHKIDSLLCLQFLISFSQLIFVFLCPGNEARKVVSVTGSFIDFNMLSFFDKVQIGLSSTFYEIIFSPNILFLILTLVLCVLMFQKTKDIFYRCIGLFPVVISVTTGFMQTIFSELFPFISEIRDGLTTYGTITLQNAEAISSYIPILIGCGVCVCVLLTIYILFDNNKITWQTYGILLLGFASRMSMSLSPTIWESGERTYLFLYISIIMCILLFIQNLILDEKWKNYIYYSMIFLVMLNYIDFYFFV